MQQFEQTPYSNPFAYQGGYAYASPPPGTPGMPPRAHTFYEGGFGAQSIPTPAPSPRTPSSTRRRSTTHDFSGTSDYVSGKRPSSSRRTGGMGHEHSEFSHDQYNTTTSPPRSGGSHRGPGYMHTPLHTPPPSAHAHHHGSPMPNIYSYVPGFVPTQEYFGGSYTPGPQSPPPRDGRRSRSHRRETTWAGEPSPRSPQRPSTTRPPSSAQAPPPPKSASDMGTEDSLRRKAAEHGIPSDYSLKNWDPAERPIILLGSVFDASSLGEWVFNWTKYHHGRHHDATKTAGGLWELLIELSSKLKRAREFFGSIKGRENREIVEDFMDSGERLWQKLKTLLKSCEEYMWRGARGMAAQAKMAEDGKTTVQMGKRSGAEFVDAMFNGEKEWERTERLMKGMAIWCQRFEVNCEEILRRPDA